MEEHREGVAFPPRVMGAAEGQMVRADLVREIVARRERGGRKWQGWRSEFQSRHGFHNDSAFFTKILDNTGDVVHYLAKFDRQIWIGRIMADLYSAHPKQWSVIGQSALEKEQLQGCDNNNKKGAEQNYPIIGQI